jgi:hypothetical protein
MNPIKNFTYKDPSWMRIQPCVQQFCKWLDKQTNVKFVLDLGTGGHHAVGLHAAKLGIKTVGTTVCVEDIKKYEELYSKNPEIMTHYTVIYQNWYYFDNFIFSKFDVILALDIAFYPIMVKFEIVKEITDKLLQGLGESGLLCLNFLKERYEPGEMTAADAHRIESTQRIVDLYSNKVSFFENLAFIKKGIP